MQIYSNKLAANLKQSLSPIYLVAGDDILLQNEACDEIRKACSKKGYDERERFNFETGFDWQSWNESCNALSLFSSQRIIELRLPSSKIGIAGSDAISRYCENPPPDTIVLIISARIEGNPKWVKAATQTGVYVPIYPLDNNQLPSWLKQRAQKNNLTLAHDAAELLAERVEGNLMAAAQELDKLALLLPKNSTIDRASVGKAVADSARFSAFNTFDHAIDGDATSACRALRHLQEEGNEPAAIIAALAHQLRNLSQLKDFESKNKMADGMRVLRINRKRQSATTALVSRTTANQFNHFIQLTAKADTCSKSVHKETAWLLIEMVLLGLAGKSLPTQRYHLE